MTRSKKLIDQLYQMGISISYDRVMELEEWIATSVCEQFEKDGVVVFRKVYLLFVHRII